MSVFLPECFFFASVCISLSKKCPISFCVLFFVALPQLRTFFLSASHRTQLDDLGNRSQNMMKLPANSASAAGVAPASAAVASAPRTKRAHRWDPLAVMSTARLFVQQTAPINNQHQRSNGDDEKDNDGARDANNSLSPVVVFCPFAAKGAKTVKSVEEKDDDDDDENGTEDSEAQQHNTAVVTSTTTPVTVASSDENVKSTLRRNKDDIVSATAFWLVDAALNRVIGRLEKDGLVAALAELVATKPQVAVLHIASHKQYAAKVLSMLPTQGQRDFFVSEFLENQNPVKLKFGNQAVGHAPDLKCAHALVAQALVPGAGACPLGEVVVQFIMWLGRRVAAAAPAARCSAAGRSATIDQTQKSTSSGGDGDESSTDLPAAWHQQLIPMFKKFAGSFNFDAFEKNAASKGAAAATTKVDATELVQCAQAIVATFLEELGEGGGRRRKHRSD